MAGAFCSVCRFTRLDEVEADHKRLRLGRKDGGRLVFPETEVERYLCAIQRGH